MFPVIARNEAIQSPDMHLDCTWIASQARNDGGKNVIARNEAIRKHFPLVSTLSGRRVWMTR